MRVLVAVHDSASRTHLMKQLSECDYQVRRQSQGAAA